MKFNHFREKKMIKKLEALRYVVLENPKMIDAIKRLRLLRLDYKMMSNVVTKTKIVNFDMLIKSLINEIIGDQSLWKDFF
jgi:hypothetical protein